MGAIHSKIKKLRIKSELTQQDMADKLNMHLKTWQKIENGITKLDVDRLKEIAKILEVTAEELINTEDLVFIHEISGNDIGFSNHDVQITHNYCSENEKTLYERMLAEKDKEIEYLRSLLEKRESKNN